MTAYYALHHMHMTGAQGLFVIGTVLLLAAVALLWPQGPRRS